MDKLGPSRLGVLRTTAPDPVLSVPRLASTEIKPTRSTVLRVWYRGLPPRSASDSGGTPSWVQGAEPPGRRSQSTSTYRSLPPRNGSHLSLINSGDHFEARHP